MRIDGSDCERERSDSSCGVPGVAGSTGEGRTDGATNFRKSVRLRFIYFLFCCGRLVASERQVVGRVLYFVPKIVEKLS